MPILSSASVQDLKRLLDLYPVSSLRDRWKDIKGTKDEMCLEIAGKRKEIQPFIADYLSCCKQHVYVYTHELTLSALVPPVIPDGELLEVKRPDGRLQMLYLVRVGFNVVLRDPLEEVTVEFLWPVYLDFTGKYLIVRFVILEKNVGAYIIGRSSYTTSRSVDENGILALLERSFSGALRFTDLHKGVKKLWHNDFMDATRTQYKKSISTASEIMDEERGIKKYNPELYAILRKSLLFKTLFLIDRKSETSVTALYADPSKGYIGFPRYSDKRGDTDNVVAEILKYNQPPTP